MAVPTRTQVNAFRFEPLATAAQRIFDLGAQIKSDGERIQTTIAGLDWDGRRANAAELRAEDEYYEFRRAAIELEDLLGSRLVGNDLHVGDRQLVDIAGALL